MDYDYIANGLLSVMETYSIVLLPLFLLLTVEMWGIFKKCGKPGWVTIIPIYNCWVLFEICDLPGWLCLIPVANAIGFLVTNFKLPKRMGKSSAFGIGCLVLPIIFFGILAFSKMENNNVESLNQEQNIPEKVLNSVPDLMSAPLMPTENIINENPNLMAANMEKIDMPINEVVHDEQFINEPPIMPEVTVSLENHNNIPNIIDMPNEIERLDTVDIVNREVKLDLLAVNEEILEMPQMSNNVINEDITITKKCLNCGAENPYINKTCKSCGSSLE